MITIFFLVASFATTLILIYMLIAIMCDTFDIELGIEVNANNYERALLIN